MLFEYLIVSMFIASKSDALWLPGAVQKLED